MARLNPFTGDLEPDSLKTGMFVEGFTGGGVLFTDGAGLLSQSLDLYFDAPSANFVVGGGAFNSISYFIGEVDFYDASAVRTLVSSTGAGGLFINPDGSSTCNLRAYGSNLSDLIFMYPFGDTITFGQASDLGGTVGIQAWTTTDTSLIIQAIGAQTGNLLAFKNAAAANVLTVNPGGDIAHGGNAIGVFGATPAAQQASGANLTNNVTSGGSNDVITNFTDLVIYANDAATIRNDIYQLARKVKQINDAMRLWGWLN